MTNEELVELVIQGDCDAVALIIQQNEGLVKDMSKRFDHIGVNSLDDLENICRYWLWKSVYSFDKTKKTKFSTHATKVIYGKLCDLYNVSMRQKRRAILEPFDVIVGDSEDSQLTRDEVIGDPDSEKWIQEFEDDEILCESMKIFLRMATPIQKGIVEARLYGYKLKDIGDYIGRSRRTVERIESECYECLRNIYFSLLYKGAKNIPKRRGEIYHIDHVVA